MYAFKGPPKREVFLWLKTTSFAYGINMERKIITHSAELENPVKVARRVSDMISEYNAEHPFEMLAKSPDVVLHQLDSGLSVLLVSPDDEKLLFHGSLYPNFENGEDKVLGMQVIEVGSWMVPEESRGHHFGTHGVEALLDLGRKNWVDPLFISTHKRVAALKVSEHNNLQLVDYEDVPYLSYLTCTCTNCSEREGFNHCQFRRSTNGIVIYEEGKIDCSLVVSDITRALLFEENCRQIHSEFSEPILPGKITVGSMVSARSLFKYIENK